MREVQMVGEAGTGAVSLQRSNGAGVSAHHHIAIKPQPEGAKATLHAISTSFTLFCRLFIAEQFPWWKMLLHFSRFCAA